MGTTSTASKWTLAGAVFVTALVATVFGLVLANYLKTKGHHAVCVAENDTLVVNSTCQPTRVINDTLCGNTDDPCKVAYYLTDMNVCQPEDAPGGIPCIDKCYASVHGLPSAFCDNEGHCTGDATHCKGYCLTADECDGLLPLNPFWVGVNDSQANVPIFWWNDCMCWANMAEQFALILFWQQSVDDPAGDAIGAGLRCKDLLDFDFVEQYESCLGIDLYLLDANATPPQYYLNVNLTEHPNCHSQFAFCAYTWNCAVLNQTFFPATRRSLGEEEEAGEEDASSSFLLHPETKERVMRPRAQAAALRLLERTTHSAAEGMKRAPPDCAV